MDTGTQACGLPSAFQGPLVGSWIKSGTAGTNLCPYELLALQAVALPAMSVLPVMLRY